MTDGVLIDKPFAEELKEWVRFLRSIAGDLRRVFGKAAPVRGRAFDRAVVILLEDVESGETGRCAVMKPVTTTDRQLIDVLGVKDSFGASPSGATWRINFTPDPATPTVVETTVLIGQDATAAEVREALEGLPSITPGDVRVELGVHERAGEQDTFQVRRWIVEFTGRYKGEQVALLDPEIASGSSLSFTVVDTTVLADTGMTIVPRAVLPVGSPTPLRRGAAGVALDIGEFGFVFIAVEARSLVEFY